MSNLRIALIGTRGIPARYGGFETFAEEISKRLAERGHSVTVYARHQLGSKKPADFTLDKVLVRSSWTIMHKYLETPLAALSAFLDLFLKRYDIVLLCNAANSPFAWLVRLRLLPLVINVDGIERNRTKWNALGKAWYRLGEICSLLFATRIVADAKVIAEYYQSTYGKSSEVIPYGAQAVKRAAGAILDQFKLQPGKYILYVSRLEPENNALGVIEAYNQIKPEIPLVIVGDAPYASQYKEKLKSTAGPGVIFTGYQFAEAYQELQSNCYLYVQATEVGGTHPALIESMAYGNCVVVNGTPENLEVIGEAGVFYAKNDFSKLAEIFSSLLNNPEQVKIFGQKALLRVKEKYSWDSVTDAYENLLQLCVNKKW